jgi:hypothetical protein
MTAGALLANTDPETVAHALMDSVLQPGRFRGVVYHQHGSPGREEGWQVLDEQGHVMPKLSSPIAEADAFVIFDEAHCRCECLSDDIDVCLGPCVGGEHKAGKHTSCLA